MAAEKQQQGANVEEGSSGAAEKVVCVTGAAGYIASWIVKLLLDRGYTVHGTVRDTDESTDPNKTLHLRALDGANNRLQLFNANLLEEGSFDAAIEGCECVFHASSPVFFATKDPKQWYILSKTLAEEAAWKFSKDNELEIVVMNPTMVISPLLHPTLNASVEVIVKLINDPATAVGAPAIDYVTADSSSLSDELPDAGVQEQKIPGAYYYVEIPDNQE